MVSNFDLIINLIVKNQDSIKNIGKDLKALEAAQELSKVVLPELSIPESTIGNLFKFAKLIYDVSPVVSEMSEALGPLLVDGLIDATEQLSRMSQIASDIGSVSIGATFDPSGSIEQSVSRARVSAQGLSQEIGGKLSDSAKESAESIDAVANSLSRVKESGPTPTASAPQITFAPQTLDETIALFDAIKATYSITTQLSGALDKAGGSRSGQINAIAQALTGVSKLVGDIYGFSLNLNDKEIKAIATSIVGLVQPLRDVGKAATTFKDSISMAGLDPAQWVKSYESAAKDLGSVLVGVGKVAIDLKKNLTSADGDTASFLKLIDLKDLQSGFSKASEKVELFKKGFDLKDIPKTILTTAKATDELARTLQAAANGTNIFADQGGNKGLENLKGAIDRVAEKYKELQGVKLPPLQSKDAVQLAQALGTTSDKAKQLQQDLNLQPKTIVAALNELNRFGSVNLPIKEQFQLLNAELGITRQQFFKLKDLQSGQSDKKIPQLEPIASKAIDLGLGKISSEAQVLNQSLGFVAAKLQEIKTAANFKPLPTNEAVAFAQSLGVTATQARSLQKELNLPTGAITSALNSIRQFESVKLPLKEQFQTLNKELGITKEQFEQIRKLKDSKPEDKTGLGLEKTFEGVSKLAFGYNNITTAVSSMVARVNPAYTAMIAANEQLNQQLLKSAATITATSAVSSADGAKLGNLESIKALQPKLKATIREVEIATQSLVGVTSQQTSEVFNVILQNTGQLNGQLKSATTQAEKFADPLDAAAKLAPGMVATLGTLGLPLSQASDEIGNLLKGEIDQTAQVAKSLGITRQMVENWKAQGTLVDQLTKRFDPFLKANAEASRSVGGLTSNIQDMFEIMNREAGKPVTDLYVDALDGVYKYLQKVMPDIQSTFTSIVQQQVTTIKAIAESMRPLFDGIMVAVTAIAPTIEPIIRSSLGLIANLFKTLEPVFSAVGQVVGAIAKAFAAMIPFIIQANAIFGVLASTTFNIGIALNTLAIPMQILVAGITAVAGAIDSIAKDPLGGIIIQAIGLTVVLAPLVNTLLGFSSLVTAFAWLPGAIAGLQTLVVTSASFLPFGGAIAAALNGAAFAANGFFATIIEGSKPPVLIEFLKSAIIEIRLMGKAFLGSALTGSIALGKELGALAVTIIPRVVAGFAAMKTGGLASGFAALTAGLPLLSTGFAGLATAVNLATAAASKFLLAYGPLVAVAAVVGLTLLAKSAKDLADVNKELEVISKTNNAISDSVLKSAQKLKALKNAASSGELNAQQKEELKTELFAAKQRLALVDAQIEANKKLREDSQKRGANAEQLSTFDQLIKEKEREKEMLSKLANEVKIASQPLAELGTSSAQMAQKVRAATNILQAGVGDPQKYAAAAKELTNLLQKQVAMGEITASEAAKQLAKLQNNTKLDYESQLAAKEAIVKLYSDRFAKIEELQSTGQLSNVAAESELEAVRTNTELNIKIRVDAAKKLAALRKEITDAELAELSARTAEVAAQKAVGEIGEAESARLTTEIKIKESKVRISQQREEANNELNPEVRRKLEAEIRKSQAEITKIEAEERDRRNAERMKDFDEQDKILKASLDKGRVSEEQYNDDKRQLDIDKTNEERKQLTEKYQRLLVTDKEGAEAIEAQAAEVESREEANRKSANDREIATLQQSIDKQADIIRDGETKKKLEVEKAIAEGKKTRAQADAEITQSSIDAAQKTIDAEQKKLAKLKSFPPYLNPKENEALQNQIRDQENKTSELQIGLIKKRLDAEKSALEERKRLIDDEYNRKNQVSRNADLDQQVELEKRVLDKSLTRAEADNLIAKSTQNRIDRELNAELKKYNELKKLKPLSNPEEEQRRQDALAANAEKVKNAELAAVKKAQEVKRSNEEVDKNVARERKEESEKESNNAKEAAIKTLESIAKANQVADEAIARSRSSRILASEKTELEALKKRGFDAESIARQSAKRELKIEQDTVEAIYKLKVSQLNQLKQKIAEGAISGEAALEAERRMQSELSDINLKRINLEKQALEQVRAEKIRQIELEATQSTNPLEKKVSLLTQQKTLLEQQNSLISAQDKLENASFNLAKQRSGFAIEDAKSAGNEAKAKQLEVAAFQDQYRFTEAQNKSKLESIVLGLEQKAIDMEMAKIQAEIAIIQSKANLEKAIAEGRSKEQLDAIRREIGLRETQSNLLNKAAENQRIIGGKELAAAKIEGQTALERDARAINKAVGVSSNTIVTGYTPGATADPFESKLTDLAKPIDAVKTGSDSLSKSLSGAGTAVDDFTKKLGGKVMPTATAIPARFTGGPIGAGELFMGAEEGPELARHGDGTYQMLMMPGIYRLDRSADIIPAHRTQELLRSSSVMGGGGMVEPIGGGVAVIDHSDLLQELRKLNTTVSSRRPQMNVPVTFTSPVKSDSGFAELNRMLLRSAF